MQVLKNVAVKKPFERLSDQRTYYRRYTGLAGRQWRSRCDQQPHRLGGSGAGRGIIHA